MSLCGRVVLSSEESGQTVYNTDEADYIYALHNNECVGLAHCDKNGEVYLTIPANGTQTGKVMVSVNGSMHELEAKTNDAESIPTGASVQITGVEGGNVLIVKKG